MYFDEDMDIFNPMEIGDAVEDGRGRKGRVLHIKPHALSEVLVEYDDPIPNGHDGNGVNGIRSGKPGHCWWTPRNYLTKVKNQYEVILI